MNKRGSSKPGGSTRPKKVITGKQRAARKKNIAIARMVKEAGGRASKKKHGISHKEIMSIMKSEKKRRRTARYEESWKRVGRGGK